MTGFDLTLIIICLVFTFFGFIRGLLRQVVIFISWVAALILASLFTPLLSKYFQSYITDDMVRALTAFFVIFILIWLVGVVVKIIVMGISEQSGVDVSRRGISAIVGFLQGVLVCLLVVFVIMNTQYATTNWYNSSRLMPIFSNWASDMQSSMMRGASGFHDFSRSYQQSSSPSQRRSRTLIQLLGGA